MHRQDPIRIFIGSGEASVLERKTLIYSLHKHSKRNLDIYVYNGTHNAIEYNEEEPFLAPLSLKLKYPMENYGSIIFAKRSLPAMLSRKIFS